MASLEALRMVDFAPLVGQAFRIRLEGVEPIDLELETVSAAGRSPREGDRTPFSLLFLGPVSSRYLLQHTYTLEHEALDALDLFIVPLGPERGRMRYQAIIA